MRTRAGPLCPLAPGLTGLAAPATGLTTGAVQVSLPTGLSAHWPGDLGPLQDMTVPGTYPRCSLGLCTSCRKSTRPNWDTWLEVIRALPLPAAPSMARGQRRSTRVTRIRVGPLCPLASVPTGLVASTLIWEKAVPGHIPTVLSNTESRISRSLTECPAGPARRVSDSGGVTWRCQPRTQLHGPTSKSTQISNST